MWSACVVLVCQSSSSSSSKISHSQITSTPSGYYLLKRCVRKTCVHDIVALWFASFHVPFV